MSEEWKLDTKCDLYETMSTNYNNTRNSWRQAAGGSVAWRKLRLASMGESAGHAVLVNSVCFQGGHAVGDWLVVGYDGQLTIRCVEVGVVFDGRPLSPPGDNSFTEELSQKFWPGLCLAKYDSSKRSSVLGIW
jgi:hypothetical protein